MMAPADKLMAVGGGIAAEACAISIKDYRDKNFAPGQPHAPAVAYDALTEAIRLCRDVAETEKKREIEE